MTDRGETDMGEKIWFCFRPSSLFWPVRANKSHIQSYEIDRAERRLMFRCLRMASAHSRGQMQFGCHQQAYFWTSVACMSIIHAFENYVAKIMLIFPPFHLCSNAVRMHYQHSEDTIQDASILHLWDKSVRKTKLCSLALQAWYVKKIETEIINAKNTLCVVNVNAKVIHFGKMLTLQRLNKTQRGIL